jgi:drug/metabolite transporter (DMT)-like permease
VLDLAGNLLYMWATEGGRMDVAAVLASLYPASTIVLAMLLLRERPTRGQAVGMALALVALLLIAR